MALLSTACAPASPTKPPPPPRIRAAGAPVLARLWPQLTTAYNAAGGRAAWDWALLPSLRAWQELAEDRLDFAIVADSVIGEQQPQWRYTPFVDDALVLIAHPDLGIEELSTSQVQAILDGSWQAANESDLATEPIRLVIRDKDSGPYQLIKQKLLPQRSITLAARILPDDDRIAKWVRDHPGAVAFVSMTSLPPDLSPIPIDGLLPSQPDYPLRYRLYVISSTQTQPAVQSWLEWLYSPVAQELLRQSFPLTPINPAP